MVVPLGDEAYTGNSVTFTPVTTVRYTLTLADLLGDGDKVEIVRPMGGG
mgnify:CR=1 FL=1